MAIQVVMPTFGMTEGEATIVRWLKAVGETVQADEPLLEAETDKATLEVPAPVDGVLLRIEAEAGQAVAYKAVVGWIGQPGERLAEGEESAGEHTPASAAQAAEERNLAEEAEEPGDGWVKASPLARRIARESAIDLNRVEGTGPGGRVVQADVLRALAAEAQGRQTLPAPEMEPVATPAAAGEVQPLSAVRRLTAERMAESFRTAPHFYLQVEVRAARLAGLRDELLPEVEQLTGARLSYTDLLLRALALLLPRHPLLNAAWQDGSPRTFTEVNLGVAVAAPQGLLVPVIHHAESLSLVDLVRARDGRARQARAGKLGPADLAGGTFTLTNLGMYGIDSFIPILNPPQAAILAAGAVAERPAGVAGQVVLQPTLHLTLAVDHRAVDGAQAAEFLRDLRALLESPARMLL